MQNKSQEKSFSNVCFSAVIISAVLLVVSLLVYFLLPNSVEQESVSLVPAEIEIVEISEDIQEDMAAAFQEYLLMNCYWQPLSQICHIPSSSGNQDPYGLQQTKPLKYTEAVMQYAPS